MPPAECARISPSIARRRSRVQAAGVASGSVVSGSCVARVVSRVTGGHCRLRILRVRRHRECQNAVPSASSLPGSGSPYYRGWLRARPREAHRGRSGAMSCASWAPRSPSRRNCVVRYMLIVAGSVGAKYPSTTRRSGRFGLLWLVRGRMVGIGVLFRTCVLYRISLGCLGDSAAGPG
jgi:hypothetical protein